VTVRSAKQLKRRFYQLKFSGAVETLNELVQEGHDAALFAGIEDELGIELGPLADWLMIIAGCHPPNRPRKRSERSA
jgi:hypothetical protein